MIEYRPNNFSDLYATELGKNLWVFLNTDEMKIRMETASDLGKPAVEGAAKSLYMEFQSDVDKLRIKQLIGHMIRQIMEGMGYQLDAQNVKITKNNLFKKGSRYIKHSDK